MTPQLDRAVRDLARVAVVIAIRDEVDDKDALTSDDVRAILGAMADEVHVAIRLYETALGGRQ